MSVGRHIGRAVAGNWGQKARLEFQGKSSWIEPVTVGRQPDTFISVGCCPQGLILWLMENIFNNIEMYREYER